MSKSQEWQCRNCGEHPSAFSGDTPSTAKCRNGGNHVWMRVPEGPITTPRSWQCLRCGSHPVSFVGNRPSSGSCKATGNKHVWVLI